MEAILSSPYYTRYILPGLTFVFLLVFLPILVLSPNLLRNWGMGEVTFTAVMVLMSGYLLDVAGAYRWWNRAYQEATRQYLRDIAEVIYPPDSIRDDFDARLKAEVVLARFWARCPEDYQKLIEEPRAKWVLALQAAFLCRLSGVFWGFTSLFELIRHRAEIGSSLGRLFIEATLIVGLLWLGSQLSKRGLALARLSDTTAITLLTDKRALLTEKYP